MTAADPALRGPLAASVRLGFMMLYGAVAVLGIGWAAGNLRQVPPESRAVVMRFGRVNRVQESGLLLAWPAPFEQVRLLPAPDRQIEYKVEAQETGFLSDETDRQLAPNDDIIHMQGERDVNNAAYLLTGDGGCGVARCHAVLHHHRSGGLSAGGGACAAGFAPGVFGERGGLGGVAQPG